METTVGQLMVNRVLPKGLRDYNRVLDKKGITALLYDVAIKHPESYREISHQLSSIGWHAAYTTGGNSFGLEHMRRTKNAISARRKLQANLDQIMDNDSLTDERRNQEIIKAVGRLAATQQQDIYEESLAEENPLAYQVLSGSRGNPMNLASLRGSDLLYTDHRGKVLPIPVLRSYSQGLSPVEYWAGAYGARKGVMDTKFATQDAGFLSKQLNQIVHRSLITKLDRDENALTLRGLPVDVSDDESEGALLAKAAGGFRRNTVITPRTLQALRAKGIKRILVRSPAVDGTPDGGVYARDAGIREFSRLPTIGENIGMTAAQALSEPLAQAQLSSKHSGGVVGASASTAVSGFDYINQLVQVPKTFKGGAAHATIDGLVQRVEKAAAGGQYVWIENERHYVGNDFDVLVQKGDIVEAGDVISDGIPNPQTIVEHKGIGEGKRYFINAFRQAFRDAGIKGHRRNIELLARGLINHVRLTEEMGDFAPDDIVPYSMLEHQYQPRPGFVNEDPRHAMGKYLERPYLHYSIGTKIRESMMADFEDFGVRRIDVHEEAPPFQPEMVRGMANLQHDPDWITRQFGSGLKGSFLKGVHYGATSDPAGTSFVPGLSRGVDFGRVGAVRQRKTAAAQLDGLDGAWVQKQIFGPGGWPTDGKGSPLPIDDESVKKYRKVLEDYRAGRLNSGGYAGAVSKINKGRRKHEAQQYFRVMYRQNGVDWDDVDPAAQKFYNKVVGNYAAQKPGYATLNDLATWARTFHASTSFDWGEIRGGFQAKHPKRKVSDTFVVPAAQDFRRLAFAAPEPLGGERKFEPDSDKYKARSMWANNTIYEKGNPWGGAKRYPKSHHDLATQYAKGELDGMQFLSRLRQGTIDYRKTQGGGGKAITEYWDQFYGKGYGGWPATFNPDYLKIVQDYDDGVSNYAQYSDKLSKFHKGEKFQKHRLQAEVDGLAHQRARLIQERDAGPVSSPQHGAAGPGFDHIHQQGFQKGIDALDKQLQERRAQMPQPQQAHPGPPTGWKSPQDRWNADNARHRRRGQPQQTFEQWSAGQQQPVVAQKPGQQPVAAQKPGQQPVVAQKPGQQPAAVPKPKAPGGRRPLAPFPWPAGEMDIRMPGVPRGEYRPGPNLPKLPAPPKKQPPMAMGALGGGMPKMPKMPQMSDMKFAHTDDISCIEKTGVGPNDAGGTMRRLQEATTKREVARVNRYRSGKFNPPPEPFTAQGLEYYRALQKWLEADTKAFAESPHSAEEREIWSGKRGPLNLGIHVAGMLTGVTELEKQLLPDWLMHSKYIKSNVYTSMKMPVPRGGQTFPVPGQLPAGLRKRLATGRNADGEIIWQRDLRDPHIILTEINNLIRSGKVPSKKLAAEAVTALRMMNEQEVAREQKGIKGAMPLINESNQWTNAGQRRRENLVNARRFRVYDKEKQRQGRIYGDDQTSYMRDLKATIAPGGFNEAESKKFKEGPGKEWTPEQLVALKWTNYLDKQLDRAVQRGKMSIPQAVQMRKHAIHADEALLAGRITLEQHKKAVDYMLRPAANNASRGPLVSFSIFKDLSEKRTLGGNFKHNVMGAMALADNEAFSDKNFDRAMLGGGDITKQWQSLVDMKKVLPDSMKPRFDAALSTVSVVAVAGGKQIQLTSQFRNLVRSAVFSMGLDSFGADARDAGVDPAKIPQLLARDQNWIKFKEQALKFGMTEADLVRAMSRPSYKADSWRAKELQALQKAEFPVPDIKRMIANRKIPGSETMYSDVAAYNKWLQKQPPQPMKLQPGPGNQPPLGHARDPRQIVDEKHRAHPGPPPDQVQRRVAKMPQPASQPRPQGVPDRHKSEATVQQSPMMGAAKMFPGATSKMIGSLGPFGIAGYGLLFAPQKVMSLMGGPTGRGPQFNVGGRKINFNILPKPPVPGVKPMKPVQPKPVVPGVKPPKPVQPKLAVPGAGKPGPMKKP